jgi:hypothetical protein
MVNNWCSITINWNSNECKVVVLNAKLLLVNQENINNNKNNNWKIYQIGKLCDRESKTYNTQWYVWHIVSMCLNCKSIMSQSSIPRINK